MSYRGEDEAALQRRQDLARRLGEASETPEREAIEREIAGIERERIEAAKRRLPLVARAYVASPCPESWETMAGDGAVRACSRCDKEVFDLSLMTLGQAKALIASRVGQEACARIFRRRDGTMMFLDCEVGPRGILRRRMGAVAVAWAIGGAAMVWANRPPPRAPLRMPDRGSDHVLFVDTQAPAYQGGQIAIAPEAPPRGQLTIGGSDVLAAAVSRRRVRLLSCYDRVRRTTPELAGAITLEPATRADGWIADARVTSDTLESAEVLECVVRTLRTLQLGARDAEREMEVTLTFAPPAEVTTAR